MMLDPSIKLQTRRVLLAAAKVDALLVTEQQLPSLFCFGPTVLSQK